MSCVHLPLLDCGAYSRITLRHRHADATARDNSAGGGAAFQPHPRQLSLQWVLISYHPPPDKIRLNEEKHQDDKPGVFADRL